MDIARAGVEPIVIKFYRQYMQQINDVTYPPGALLVNPDVQDCLYRYFFDASRNKYLPPPWYQVRILRRLIEEIENSCKDPEQDQVSDHLMEHMGYLSSLPHGDQTDEAQQSRVHSYYPPLSLDARGVRPILINEASNLLSRGSNVGLRTWEAALHLAWYLFTQRPDIVNNKHVLELGAGTGFLSLLCAIHLKASSVLATDGSGLVCESLENNVLLNKQNGTLDGCISPEVLQLDWTDQPAIAELLSKAEKSAMRYDLIIGADVTYHPDILRPLAELLSILKARFPDVVILISAAIRSETFSQFAAICRDDLKFTVREVPCKIPDGLRYCGFFHSVATEIKIVSLER
ncbi:hypothetical protein AYO21_09472 [Fonsecaea monophora]|uniref:FAM86 N-terminal domain-containing protein n=1 Tax=Fonsecaea monophora TaxID=254056 RepID=A0A177EW87_9EURO|nr:hypothetical protein AYO21_09472 [Fonsecaea monophora]KAH0837639.1 hypothetical protein FOPE_05114 [Fonsecaea pedrosoi]OAG36307.1 hypothetical protein AYO21_09472 [Fonsecaea monophora]